MQFPVPREAFAHIELDTLVRAGHTVGVHSLRPSHRLATVLSSQRGLAGLDIRHGGPVRVMHGLWQMLRRPMITLRALKWLAVHSQGRFTHLAKSMVLLPASMAVAMAIRKQNPDVVHVFWGHYPALVLHLLRMSGSTPVRSLFLGAYDLNTNWLGSVSVAMDAHVVVTHSEVNVHHLEKLGIPNDKVVTVRRGIRISPMRREESEDGPGILVASALIPSKRVDLAIQVAARLQQSLPACSLTVCGEGRDRLRLEALVSQLGCEDSVTFLGHVPHDQLLVLMRQHRYLVHLTEYPNERLPNVIKEAMAFGCLVLTTSTAGIEELLEDGEQGVIVQRGDVDSCVDAILNLERDPSRREVMVRNARARIERDFDAVTNVAKLAACWKAHLP